MSKNYSTQNDLLLTNLLEFYNTDNNNNMDRMLQIINGESRISLRIIDWFATNYAKKYYTVYQVQGGIVLQFHIKTVRTFKPQLVN